MAVDGAAARRVVPLVDGQRDAPRAARVECRGIHVYAVGRRAHAGLDHAAARQLDVLR